jgi:3-isopropylmalate/(R)-2-methylmalate dehydratase small subunit
LTVDLPAQTVSDTNGLSSRFEIDDFRKHILLEGLDEIGLTMKYAPRITEFEKTHRPGAIMYSHVDAKYATQK